MNNSFNDRPTTGWMNTVLLQRNVKLFVVVVFDAFVVVIGAVVIFVVVVVVVFVVDVFLVVAVVGVVGVLLFC